MMQLVSKGVMKVNFKIESNFIDITNYPSVERHLEKMANKGWLINKIVAGNIFIYKKIEPEELDFSIALYEVETAFTRKSKEELDEFNSVCESVGWNYATKSFNLHIYFKEKGTDAMEIQTDDEEEFSTLEFIGKKYIKSNYIQIPFMIFLAWMNIGSLFTSVYSIKDGLGQIVAPMIALALIVLIVQTIHIKRFLKANKNNIEMGKDIEYSDSKFCFYKVTFLLSYIIISIFTIYILYLGIVLKKKFVLIAFIPILIGLIIGCAYRFLVKPSKIKLKNKKIGLVATLIITTIISIFISIGIIMYIGNGVDDGGNPNIDGYKVLSIDDFEDNVYEYEGTLMQGSSILVPKSYEYYSYARKSGSIITEYSKALTEDLAKNLVSRYIRQARSASVGRYGRDLEFYFEEGIYDDYFLDAGITRNDFNNLKANDIKEFKKALIKMIKEKAIIKDEENLWNLDETYFLSYDKMEIVIRDGKEVFYLEGKDFSDVEIINIIKEKLDLN